VAAPAQLVFEYHIDEYHINDSLWIHLVINIPLIFFIKRFNIFTIHMFRFCCCFVRNELCLRPPQYAPAPVTFIFDLLTYLKVVSESRVSWATSVPILVFLGLSGLDLGPM